MKLHPQMESGYQPAAIIFKWEMKTKFIVKTSQSYFLLNGV
jgi:hypothetical protein